MNPRKYRKCTDESRGDALHPSVNAGIDRSLCRIAYGTVNDLCQLACDFKHEGWPDPRGGKDDARDAYRLIPNRPSDYGSCGYSHRGTIYVDARLCFGRSSACRIYSSLSMTNGWLMAQGFGCLNVVYLDDCGRIDRDAARSRMSREIYWGMCELLGILLSEPKSESQSRVMV